MRSINLESAKDSHSDLPLAPPPPPRLPNSKPSSYHHSLVSSSTKCPPPHPPLFPPTPALQAVNPCQGEKQFWHINTSKTIPCKSNTDKWTMVRGKGPTDVFFFFSLSLSPSAKRDGWVRGGGGGGEGGKGKGKAWTTGKKGREKKTEARLIGHDLALLTR